MFSQQGPHRTKVGLLPSAVLLLPDSLLQSSLPFDSLLRSEVSTLCYMTSQKTFKKICKNKLPGYYMICNPRSRRSACGWSWCGWSRHRLGQLLANKGYRVSNGDCGTCGFTQTGERLNSLLGIHSGRSACFNRVVVHYVLLSEKARPVAGGLLAIWCIWICKATTGHAPLNLVP